MSASHDTDATTGSMQDAAAQPTAAGLKPQYANVENWVRDYLLPSFPRPAGELGATKIALGHHRDDVLATFFLNLFHAGTLKAMPAKLLSDDGRHVVIRPLAYVAEDDLAAYAEAKAFPIIPCTLCGSQENLQRKAIGQMLRDWEKNHPGRIESILRAMTEVRPSHLLDRKLFDFVSLEGV